MLGAKLINFREKHNLTIDELALRINISSEEILMWENDEVEPSLEKLIILANTYNVSLDELIGRKVKTKIKEGYFARTYVKYNDNIYNELLNRIFNGNIKFSLIFAIVFFVILCISIVLDLTGLRWVSILCIFLSLILRSSSKKSKELYFSNMKNTYPELEHYLWFYENKIQFMSKSKNGSFNHSFDKSDIKLLKHDEQYIVFIASGMYIIIDKKMTDGNLEKIDEFFNINDNKTPKKKFLLGLLSILSISTLIVGLITVGALKNSSPIPEFTQIRAEYAWVLLLFIPIPIVSSIVGIYYKRKGQSNKNFVIGIVMTILLLFFSLVVSSDKKYISHDENYINELEKIVNIDLPSEGDVSILYYDDYYIDYALIRFTGDELKEFKENIVNDYRFTNDFDYECIDNYYYELYNKCEYFCLYDIECGSYNIGMNYEHAYHNQIMLGYDVHTDLLVVVYLYNNYGAEI